MQTEENSENIDPRNAFLFLLVNKLALAQSYIYEESAKGTYGLRVLHGILDVLDKKSQDELKTVHDKIEQWQETGQFYSSDCKAAFTEISVYLHKEYLQEAIRGAKPQNPKGGHFS